MSKFDSCLLSLNLRDSLPVDVLKSTAAEYEARGIPADAARLRAVEDQLALAVMERDGIMKVVREQYEARGGKKKKAKVPEVAPAAEEVKAAKPKPAPADTAPAPIEAEAPAEESSVEELTDLTDQRTIEVDGERRPIRYSNGELVAPDFAGQVKFWQEYKGEVDDRGRPVAQDDVRDVSDSLPLMVGEADPEVAPKRVATTQKLKAAQRALDEGRISPEVFRYRIELLVKELGDRNAAKAEASVKPRERGPEWVIELLMRARRTGEIDGPTVNFALWALGKNPQLATDLGISLRAQNERGTAGLYHPASRVMTLFKGAENVGTAVHEILHHSERMMPPAVQEQIVKAWQKEVARAYVKANDKQRAALDDMFIMAADKQAAERVVKAFGNGTLDYDTHYQLSNASEYWAVNATRILAERHAADSWVAKAKQWLSELVQKVRGWLGVSSDAAVLRGLQSVLDGTGERLSPRMLLDQQTMRDIAPKQTETPAFKRWFGDSVVVDKKGEPLVVHHGSPDMRFMAEDGVFKSQKEKLGFGREEAAHWFAASPATARSYADPHRAFDYQNSEPGTMQAYLKLENPLIVDGGGQKWRDAQKSGKTTDVIREAREGGHDGVIIRNVRDNYQTGVVKGDAATDTYVVFKSSQIKSATNNSGAFDPSDPSVLRDITRSLPDTTWAAPEMTKLDDIVHTLQDKHIDMKKVVKAIREQTGALEDKWNPYLQEELFHGRSATGFKSFLHDELRPLLDDMKMRGVEMAEFEQYLHARHAQEANEQIARINPDMPDGGSGMGTQDALDYLDALPPAKARAYAALAARVDAITRETQRMLVDYGLEKQETIDAWNATYQHYVPLQREDMDAVSMGNGTGQGFSIRGSSSQRRMGSSRTVVDILANVAMAREKTVVRGEKNRLDVALYGLALKAPNPEFWKPINPQKNPAALQAELVNMGLSPAMAQSIIDEPKQRVIDPRTGLVVKRVNTMLRSSPNVVAARIGGEDRFIFFNERNERALRMAQSLKNIGIDQLGGFTSAMATITRYFAAINTQYNPIFGIVNLVRDVGESSINLSSTPIAGKQAQVAGEIARLLAMVVKGRGRLSNLTGADATLWDEFQSEGGITGFRAMFNTSADRAKELAHELDPDGWMESKWGKVFTAGGTLKVPYSVARKVATPLFDWLSDYNEALENITRMATYKVGKANGMTKQQAASMAKSISVNFNRSGAVTKQVGSLYAFFNAAAQGMARMAETLNGPAGKRIIAGGLLLGVVQAVMLAAAGFDDEPPEFVKAGNFIIPLGVVTGKKNYITIPLPMGFRFLPSTGRLFTEYALGGAKHTGRYLTDLMGVYADNFNPIGNAGVSLQTILPTAVDPLAALAENRDFTGKPIARKDMSALHPTPGHTRAKDTASAIGKAVSYYSNLWSGGTEYTPGVVSPTPDQIDYLLGQFTGGVGREAIKAQQTVSSAITGEDLPSHKMPLVGRFYGEADEKSSVSTKFYANLLELNLHREEVEGRAKDHANPRAYLAEHPEAKLADMAQAVERDLAALRKHKRDLVEKGASKERVMEVELKSRKLMAKLNDKVEQVKKEAVAQ